MAVNCSVLPWATESATGETVMLTSVAGVTVNTAVPWTSDEGSVAVMSVAPVPAPVASPAVEMEAVEVSDDAQMTVDVRFSVLRLE